MKLDKNSWMYKLPIAHRGYHDSNTPENSLKAFEKTMKNGYAIELDVHILKDSNIIVFHDDDLYRMTSYDKKVKDVNYFNEIKDLYLLKTNEHIPLLEDVLELINGSVPLLIELKNTGEVGFLEKELLKLLENYKGDFILQSFNPFRVRKLKQLDSSIKVGLLSGLYINSNLSYLSKITRRNLLLFCYIKADFINYQIEGLDRFLLKLVRFLKIPLFSWTARNNDNYKYAMKKSDNVVFEGFNIEDVR